MKIKGICVLLISKKRGENMKMKEIKEDIKKCLREKKKVNLDAYEYKNEEEKEKIRKFYFRTLSSLFLLRKRLEKLLGMKL